MRKDGPSGKKSPTGYDKLLGVSGMRFRHPSEMLSIFML